MEPFYGILRQYPELAVFLTLAIGFYIGRLKIAGCSIGSVTGVLLTGLLIGQADIPISPAIKSVFFLFFLFAVGYGVGPQFFRGLKSEGLGQALFATLVSLVCLVTAFLTARLFGLGVGYGAGVFGGACTVSSVLGVATDAIHQLGGSPSIRQEEVNAMSIAFAITTFLALREFRLSWHCLDQRFSVWTSQPNAGLWKRRWAVTNRILPCILLIVRSACAPIE
jgi:putative transport protein